VRLWSIVAFGVGRFAVIGRFVSIRGWVRWIVRWLLVGGLTWSIIRRPWSIVAWLWGVIAWLWSTIAWNRSIIAGSWWIITGLWGFIAWLRRAVS